MRETDADKDRKKKNYKEKKKRSKNSCQATYNICGDSAEDSVFEIFISTVTVK